VPRVKKGSWFLLAVTRPRLILWQIEKVVHRRSAEEVEIIDVRGLFSMTDAGTGRPKEALSTRPGADGDHSKVQIDTSARAQSFSIQDLGKQGRLRDQV
jgi:hypothetical protein